MIRNILVTGGSGFVGRQILKALATQPVKLRLITRNPEKLEFTSTWSNVEQIITTPDLFAEGADWWQKICDGVDTLIHAAWYAEPGKYLDSPLNLDCLIGSLQMAKGAASAGIRRLVGLGTCLEYASSDKPHDIDSPLQALTTYAGAKVSTFTALAQWLPQQGVEFCWCRLFHLYGEGEDPRRLLPYLHAKFVAGEIAELSSGSQTLDFLNVALAGKMIADAALGNTQGATNICSGSPITVREIAERIADEYGRRDLLHFGVRPDHPTAPTHLVGIPGQGCAPSNPATGKGKP